MNRHAEKPADPRDAAEAREVALGLDVRIEEIHACRCGAMASRPGD